MSADQWYMIVPNTFLSALLWILIFVVVLYLARDPAHRVIHTLFRTLAAACNTAVDAILGAHASVLARNREVLLAQGREEAERIIEREFERIDASVRRDLAKYPALQRQISEEITRIEEDFAASSTTPPSPPSWVKAVEAVAGIPSNGDPMVAKTLEIIHTSLVDAQKRAEATYREESQKRHGILSSMMPAWRRVTQALESVNKSVDSLLERGRTIDRHMEDYEQIIAGTEAAERKLSSSSMVQFFISAFVMAIALGGAVINFNLIARPMSEMVGGNGMIGGFKTSDIAALVIILVEISMGLFLMESLRITRLFPVIGALPDRMRVKMLWITFGILTALASVEAGLAYMREILLQDELATNALLRGDGAASFDTTFTWITTSAQMGMGFILPFALVFVAIPLETFIHSLRTVIGILTGWALRALAFVFLLLAGIFGSSGQMLGEFYDMVIFLPERIGRKLGFSHGEDFGASAGDSGAASLSGSLVSNRRKQVEPAE
ncbi:MAG: hypothetical protein IID51_12665 [Proteobacteria bacterium]|nr:hypothetical protein [Pseudomonadota bacterium]